MSPAPENASAQLVYVLGMHRSGTSAVTRALNLLGAGLGQQLMAPQAEDNPRGYWEHQEIQRLHQDFLAQIDRSWDDPRCLPRDTWARPEAEALVAALAAELSQELRTEPFFAIKDPRMCILGPIWDQVQVQTRHQASAVAVLRHPRGVIDSLARRSEVPSMLSLWLWWRHNLGWLELSRTLPRVLLVFEELVVDPEAAIARVQQLDLPWRDDGAEAAAASIESDAPRSLGRERPEDVDPDWWAASLELYEALRLGPRSGPTLLEAELESRLRERMDGLDAQLEPLGFLIRSESRHRWAHVRGRRSIETLEARRRASEDSRRRAEAKLQAIEGSGGYQALRRLQRLRRRLWPRS